MMRIKEAYHMLLQKLQQMYIARESSQIADIVMESITGYSRTERLVHQDSMLDTQQMILLTEHIKELEGGRPVQYVLGKCWFQDMPFKVDERALIPRPETEELVEYIKNLYRNIPCQQESPCKIIDIGTGTGCIAISLKKVFPSFEVWAVDKSAKAIELAKENDALLDANILFKQTDILEESKNDSLPAFNIIVSNPPYIPQHESKELDKHVIDFEPHDALFVTNNDPLEFYKAIIEFSEHHLLRGGMIFFETHQQYAKDVFQLLEESEFEQVQLHKDFQGKDRIVSGRKTGASL